MRAANPFSTVGKASRLVSALRWIVPMGAGLGLSSTGLAQGETQHFPEPLRYDEDYSYLADPAQRQGDWDPIKYVPLSADGASYLSFGGELRERFEATNNPAFGLTEIERDSVLLHRLLLSADTHLGPSFRAFVQLGAYAVSGRKGRPLPTDENRLDLQQGFVDFAGSLGEGGRASVRIGRQEINYGSGRFVAVREGPNGRRSFDGLRGMYRSPTLDADIFATRTVALEPGTFDDRSDDELAFWGAYVTRRLPGKANLDAYYFGLEQDNAVYALRSGKEQRHTVGLRFWGTTKAFDYNIEAAYQFGTLSNQTIRAFGASADIGYELARSPFQPRLGLKANIESGDGGADDDRFETFNPLFPNHAYFSEAAFGAPMNAMDLQPNVTLRLAPRLSLVAGYDFFWKQNRADAVYSSVLLPFPGTAGTRARYIGSMLTTHARWQLDRHLEFNLDFSRFDIGSALRQAGGADATFVMASVANRF